ncbi:MAG: hypothetical protein GQ570_08160 [Helicobacteraceae bacterium]|nr:hypothetical protein [Helicobacteraceae bacterium]
MEIIGAHGTKGKDSSLTTFLIDEKNIIDAGNLIIGLDDRFLEVENIFITHPHLDHIVDLPLIIDAKFEKLKHQINIFGIHEVLKVIKECIFNNSVWPDFSKINLINSDKPVIKYHEIEYNKVYKIGENSIMPFENNHTKGSCGFIINNYLMITSDTHICNNIYDILNENKDIKVLVTELSFPSFLHQLAIDSKHLTPKILKDELSKLNRDDLKVYVNHIKFVYMDVIKKEIEEYGLNIEVLDEQQVLL